MTLIVSLRIPDGIVIAGDSFSTMITQLQVMGELDVTCPDCGHQHTLGPQPMAQVAVPSTTFSYAQKVFPFMKDYGVGCFGTSLLTGKTIFFAKRELEEELRANEAKPNGVEDAAKMLAERLHDLLKAQMPDLNKADDKWHALGFQMVGYEEGNAKTVEIHIGKTLQERTVATPGCTVSGQNHVALAIWGLYKQHPEHQAQYSAFSLQDAIAYAEFLISTTASYQRFSRMIPTVGGDIDIGLVTPFADFKWIKQKPLSRVISEDE